MISFDSESHPSSFEQNNSWTHTVGGGSQGIAIVIASLSGASGDPITITFGGVAMTKLADYSGSSKYISIYYLLNPSAGSNTVVCNWDGGYYCSVTCLTFFGVSQSSPFRSGYGGAAGTSTSPSNTIDSSATDVLVDAVCEYNLGTLTCDASQTQRFVGTDYLYTMGVSTKSGTGATDTMSWTLGNSGTWAIYSLSLQEGTPTSTLDEDIPFFTITASSDGINASLPMLGILNGYIDVPYAICSETLPVLTMTAQCSVGGTSIGDLDEELPLLTMEGTVVTGEISQIDIDIPLFSITSNVKTGTISRMDALLPPIEVVGQQANSGSLDLELPAIDMEGYVFVPSIITIEETLPMFEIVASMAHEQMPFRAVAMNLKNSGLSIYDNFNFNSFCSFKGKNLGACSNGIMVLDGINDNGTNIAALVNLGNLNFKLPGRKRIADAYLTLKGNGNYVLRVVSDRGIAHDYSISNMKARSNIVKSGVGKGKKGNFFEMELRNVDGADFELHEINLNVDILGRKV